MVYFEQIVNVTNNVSGVDRLWYHLITCRGYETNAHS